MKTARDRVDLDAVEVVWELDFDRLGIPSCRDGRREYTRTATSSVRTVTTLKSVVIMEDEMSNEHLVYSSTRIEICY